MTYNTTSSTGVEGRCAWEVAYWVEGGYSQYDCANRLETVGGQRETLWRLLNA